MKMLKVALQPTSKKLEISQCPLTVKCVKHG